LFFPARPKIRQRPEFSKPGVYIANVSDEELYIGQGDVVRTRLESHVQNKDFWSKGIAFVSSTSSGGLNRAHATWLEHALIHQAVKADRSHLENSTEPQEPQLSEAEKADTQAFLREMLQILPLVGLNAFEIPKAVAQPMAKSADVAMSKAIIGDIDTIVVPAKKEGFESFSKRRRSRTSLVRVDREINEPQIRSAGRDAGAEA
jgi:predicted GIY-YIG superfamily endonuclease